MEVSHPGNKSEQLSRGQTGLDGYNAFTAMSRPKSTPSNWISSTTASLRSGRPQIRRPTPSFHTGPLTKPRWS